MLWFYGSFFPVVWIVFVLYWQIKAADATATRRQMQCLRAWERRIRSVPRSCSTGCSQSLRLISSVPMIGSEI